MFGLGHFSSWQERLDEVVGLMRELSTYTDPQEMVNAYGDRVGRYIHSSGYLGLSRRGLEWPQYRVTRSSTWEEDIDPWRQRDRLPLLTGGMMAEIIYSNKPWIIRDLQVPESDPAYEYLRGHRAMLAIPHFDRGESLNLAVHLYEDYAKLPYDDVPEMVWMSNLFGRGVNNLALAREVKTAYDQLDQELKAVADIQRSLLPSTLPAIPGVELAAHYQTSRRAGGDYYDFFPLDDGQWGIFMADVSGHGTPAAVVMAITHSLAHGHPGPPTPPGSMLSYLNRKLCGYAQGNGTFVTAFYGVYDPAGRRLTYSSAGHPAARLRRAGAFEIEGLEGGRSLPLGIMEDAEFEAAEHVFGRGDSLLLYTDGVTESFSPDGEMFGEQRLDRLLLGTPTDPKVMVNAVRAGVDMFTYPKKAEDDRTLMAMRIS